ncbi:MAG: hypothetical protein HRT87_05320 [Legionellales bacterium]|nr:hypothetical protein [Legionellales bacterium]
MTIARSVRLKKTHLLKNFWQEKEYRNFPVEVTNYITADSSVCAEARMCWILLFTMSFYDKNWCIQISKSDLAEKLNKDKSSIERYLRDLKKVGYIDIESVKEKGVWLPSKIYVNVPPALFDLLEKAPNRKRASNDSEYNANKKHSSSKMFHVEPQNGMNTEGAKAQPPYHHKCRKGILTSEVSNNNIYINNKYTNNKGDLVRLNSKIQKSVVVDFDNQKTNKTPIRSEKIVAMKSKDTSYSDNSRIIQELELELKPLQEKLKSLSILEKAKFYSANMLGLEEKLWQLKYSDSKSKLDSMESQLKAGDLSQDVYDLQKQKVLKSKLELLKIQDAKVISGQIQDENTQDIKAEISFIELELKKLSAIDSNKLSVKSQDYLTISGQRTIDESQAEDLKMEIGNTLKTSDDRQITKIANEIAYQVRFGNLQISYQTGQAMSVKHGINVALKKLREGEWSRPTGMSKAA